MSLDSNLQSAFTAVGTAIKGKISSSEKGVANGVATLDGTGKIPTSQIPGSIEEVVEYANFAALPATGVASRVYVTIDNNKTWRWSGSTYIEISPSDVSSVNGMTGAVTIGVGNISGLQGQLDGKAATVHTHAIADVSGLQTALDGKASASTLNTLVTGVGATDTNYVTVFNAALV
jgi:hypothetical protein